MKIELTDGVGHDQAGLLALADDVALPTAGGLAMSGAAITLQRVHGRAVGLEISSICTRRLPFERTDLA